MTELPNTHEELSKLLRDIASKATELADEQDRVVYEQRPESIREAVATIVSCLYFYGQPSKEATALEHVLELLASEVWRVYENDGPAAAYRLLNSEPT